MKVTRRDALSSDAVRVIADLSAVSADEMNRIGVRKDAREVFLFNLIKTSEAFAYCADGQPVFLLGFIKEKGNKLATWFVGTNKLFGAGLGGILMSRRVLREIRARYAHCLIESTSYGKHPDAKRWFETLGFKQTDVNDQFTTYRLAI